MGQIGRIIDKALDILIVGAGSGFLILLTTATFIEVFTRYIWGFSTSQVSSWCVFFLMWLSFGTIGIVLKEKRHITMGTLGEILTHYRRKKTVLCLEIFISFTIIIFSIAFSYMGMLAVMKAKASGYNTQIDYVPYYWVWFLSLPVGALTLLFYAIRDVVSTVGQLVKPSALKDEASR
jgi:TRAP-type C4-dicarboxylate transport system permease small subunit